MNGHEDFLQVLLSLTVAFVLAIPIGWERDRQGFGPGLRTYPLVAIGACAYLEIGQSAFPYHIDAQARVFQAVVSGIGFIGAGAIMKGHTKVHGLATAVSLWITVSMGIAASYQRFALAVVLAVMTLGTLRLLEVFKAHPEEADEGPEDARPS